MDFEFTEAEQHFRAELRQFLADELPDWWRSLFVGDERTIPMTRELCGKLAARGWLTMSWPREHGGQEASTWSQVVLREEMWSHGEPRGPQYMNVNYIGPMIMKFGSSEQKERFLPPMAGGRVLWCQGFSEPGAGSDLPALSTSARRTDAGYVVNGQKIWTSYADKAEWIFCLVRTDPANKYQGITFLLFDMASAGVSTRPILLISGYSPFCETFFDDVKVPKTQVVGEINRGWDVAKYLLSHEREMISGMGLRGSGESLPEIALASAGRDDEGRLNDPLLRARIARYEVRSAAFRALSERYIDELKAGHAHPAQSSRMKYVGTELAKSRHELTMAALGTQGLVWEGGSANDGAAARAWLRSKGNSIEGGTSEIQLNVVAKRLLDLPEN
jgi:alkylation response protein AidB-like acyl-CoA dehydrogenase